MPTTTPPADTPTSRARRAANVPARISLGVLRLGFQWVTRDGSSAFIEQTPRRSDGVPRWRWELSTVRADADPDVDNPAECLVMFASGTARYLHTALIDLVRADLEAVKKAASGRSRRFRHVHRLAIDRQSWAGIAATIEEYQSMPRSLPQYRTEVVA